MTDATPITLPGQDAFEPALAVRLREALEAQGDGYVPRTHHLGPNGAPRFINRLIFETSPYLLQHAHNPVSWFAWGEEAFALARALDRPILLSVGYATCHWCHVMERESFEDEEIAAFINANFIAVKVDREERPDVDSVYMTVVQMMTGRGGWPMTVVMTPDKRPYFGGTYFPARDGDRGARMGFISILKRLADAYRTERERVLGTATQVSQSLARMSRPNPAETLPAASTLAEGAHHLAGRFDKVHGGFGRAPKFPRPADYELLLRYARRTGDARATHIVAHSLRNMANGGIYDHLAGGFARYSTDQRWLVPHFEKMLYDNAQLAALALETWQVTGDAFFAAVAEDVLDYVQAEMTAPGGAFYSATDADSEGEEGKFFVWTPAEITAVLGEDLAQVAIAYWGVTERGNFEHRNILYRPQPEDAVAEALGLSVDDLRERVEAARNKLYAARNKRIPPLLDDKVLTEWNGQMISAFARVGFARGKPTYIQSAAKAADFLLEHLVVDGRLARAHRAGRSRHGAVLEDYAAFIGALLDLFEATAEAKWLDEAIRLQSVLEAYYLDAGAGGFYATPEDGEALLVREKPDYDGAQPSGNSVTVHNLMRLHALTARPEYRATAEATLRALGQSLTQNTPAVPKLVTGLDWFHDPAKEIVLVQTPDDGGASLQDVLRQSFLPHRALVIGNAETLRRLQPRVPWLEAKTAMKGRATVYVCKDNVCKQPTSEPEVLRQQLAEHEPLAAPPLPID